MFARTSCVKRRRLSAPLPSAWSYPSHTRTFLATSRLSTLLPSRDWSVAVEGTRSYWSAPDGLERRGDGETLRTGARGRVAAQGRPRLAGQSSVSGLPLPSVAGDRQNYMTKASVVQQLATESMETIRTPAPPPMNEVQVPLLSPHLRDQIFPPRSSPSSPPAPTQAAVSISVAHLRSHGLLAEPSAVPVPGGKHKKAPEDAIDFVLPALQGETIIDHFKSISAETAEPYLSLAQSFATFELPPMPDKGTWLLSSGWTHYSIDGAVEQIDYPSEAEEVMVFDVETLPYVGGHYPVMAVAVGREGWYGWCSPWLVGDSDSPNHLIPFDSPPPADLAPLSLFEQPQQSPRLLIGHNVLFDRARVSSEYTLRRPSSRWLDTQSLHVAVSGLTSPQRPAWMMHRKNLLLQAQKDAQAPLVAVEAPLDADEEEGPPVELPPPSKEKDKGKEKVTTKEKSWQEVSSMNSLAEVAKLHCKITVDKSMRNVFIDHSTGILDVRNNFDELMHYCATDVLTTQSVYQVLLPRFLQKCAHPASFAGILIMSQPILPVDTKWPLYLSRAETMYIARLKGCKDALHVLAEEARAKMSVIDPATGKFVWETDLWLRQMDWTPKKARRLPDVVPQLKRKLLKKQSEGNRSLPTWFSSLKKDDDGQLVIPLQSSTAAALLRCTYRSFPTYFSTTKGWIFAAPKRKSITLTAKELPVEMEELGPKDERIQALRGVKFFTIPAGRAGTKRNKLLVAKDVDSGVVASVFPEMKVGIDPTTEVDSEAYRQVQQTLSRLAHEAVEEMSTIAGPKGAKDLWLRQLDWSLVDVLYADQYEQSIPNLVPPKETDLVWPTWYHDLDKPGLGLDVSIGKRVAPLLLRLRWKSHPLVYSKEHGWTYRIPDLLAADTLAADPSLVPVLFHDIADANLADDRTGVFVKLPHTDGEEKNVGNPLSKAFVSAFENDVLSSEFPAAKAALELNASCSYWAMARERIMNQMVIWDGKASIAEPTPDAIERGTSDPKTRGIILPQVTPMGTVTRRAVERTWLTASNAKKNRVGSELKSMVVAPPGYSIVGADVDSEELWICSVMGDAQFGIHGATAIGWMTLEGTKSAGTDLHSKTASILGISRDDAKVFNYSRIYGAGVKHAVSLLIKANPALTKDAATALAKNLYASTKGLTSRVSFNRDFWHGGTESFVFNKLEEIAQSDEPLTPALGCGITDALTKVYLPKTGRDTYLPSRINWVVQSSGVDYLHLLLVSMEYLTRKFGIDARYMISVHDEVRYLVREEDRYRAAMALQISNLWTRALFSHRLQIADLPQSCAFFSAVDVDHVFRKEVNMNCLTPSNPDSIPFGESLDIAQCLSHTFGGSLYPDGRPMPTPSSPLSTTTAIIREGEKNLHRVTNLNFLTAQTEKKSIKIKQLWRNQQRSNLLLEGSRRKGIKNSTSFGSPLLALEVEMEGTKEEGKEGERERDDRFDLEDIKSFLRSSSSRPPPSSSSSSSPAKTSATSTTGISLRPFRRRPVPIPTPAPKSKKVREILAAIEAAQNKAATLAQQSTRGGKGEGVRMEEQEGEGEVPRELEERLYDEEIGLGRLPKL